MATPEKIATIAEFTEKLKNSEVAIATKYMGIKVEQVTDLRKKLRAAGVEFKVYKNTLVRLALRELGLEPAADFMEGPMAWAFSKDPATPAKILKQYANEVKFVSMAGGILSGKVVNKDQLMALASLPPREQLLAQVVGVIAAPLSKLAGVLNALPRNLVSVLDQIRRQKEETGAAVA